LVIGYWLLVIGYWLLVIPIVPFLQNAYLSKTECTIMPLRIRVILLFPTPPCLWSSCQCT